MELFLNANVAYIIIVLAVMFILAAIAAPGTGIIELVAVVFVGLSGFIIFSRGANWWALLVAGLSIVPFFFAIRTKGVASWLLLGLTCIMLIVGSVFLFTDTNGNPEVSPVLAIASSAACTGLLWLAVTRAIKAQTATKHHDMDALVGQIGEARTDILDEGSVYVGGELWSAKSASKVAVGESVRITGREGFILIVEKR